jgi:hypothetical protein
MHTDIADRSNAPKSMAVIVPAPARRKINENRTAAIN